MQPRFDYLPVALVGSVMGLTGPSAAWRLASMLFGVPIWISDVIAAFAALAFVAMATAYAIKLITAPDAVKAEFEHPIAINTFATFWVSMLLLPIVLANADLVVARILWSIGAVGIMVFAWYVVYRWTGTPVQREHVMPAWILPVVGLLDLPLAVPLLALPYPEEIMTVGLAVGLLFTSPLFTLILARLLFEPALSPAVQPSLLILVAPFAVGMSAYVATTGLVDLFAESLYVLTIFMLSVLLGRLRHLGQCCPFRMGWWAVSFPIVACAIAALRFSEARPGWATDSIGVATLLLASGVITWLLVRTLMGISRGELRALAGP